MKPSQAIVLVTNLLNFKFCDSRANSFVTPISFFQVLFKIISFIANGYLIRLVSNEVSRSSHNRLNMYIVI